MSSCYLVDMFEDSIDGIYDTLKECEHLQVRRIGLSVSNARTRRPIKGTNGASDGIVPWRRCSTTPRAGSTRAGNGRGFAMYLEPWHADIMSFVDLAERRLQRIAPRPLPRALGSGPVHATRGERRRLEPLCPNEAPALTDVCGAEFDELYERYEREGRYREDPRSS
jgi:hypothetical protein